MNTKSNGYILILTLMILSILIIVVTNIFYTGTAHNVFSKTIIDREKAKMLALSGVQLAISKLTLPEEKKSQEEQSQEAQKKNVEDKKTKNNIRFLSRILPILNSWIVINLKSDNEEIDGQVKICICCEDGKININKIFDYSKKRFINDGILKDFIKILDEINKKIRSITSQDLLKPLEQFLIKRKFPLNDVTELLLIPQFSYFKNYVFYEPPIKGERLEKRPIYLTDIFTTWTDNIQLQPWLLSDSVAAILGLKRIYPDEIEKRKNKIEQWIKNFKSNSDWVKDWDKIMKPLYEKELLSMPKGIEILFNSEFDPNIFSVVSYGTVGEITQKVFAILRKNKSDEATFEVIKLYSI